MKYNRFFVLVIAAGSLLFASSCSSPHKHQSAANVKATSIVFYNVENLFDTIDNQGKADFEFTPQSKKDWNTKRYEKKINDIAHVLMDIDTVGEPGLIGMAEIENQSVLEDLVKTKRMKPYHYKIIHEESPDYRGIDVALLYRPDLFKEISHQTIGIHFPNDPNYHTRDILYAKLLSAGNDTLNVFVNHWPSRLGGQVASEPQRVFVASVLKIHVDSVLKARPNGKVIIIGDMNDTPLNKSLHVTLGATPDTTSQLHNLMYKLAASGKGTYYFRGDWDMLDNLVVSHIMLEDPTGWHVKPSSGHIFHERWMEYKNRKGILTPNRTYGGPNYYGGVSDHFPVYAILNR